LGKISFDLEKEKELEMQLECREILPQDREGGHNEKGDVT
jgi:hypothetical protein